MDKLQKLLQSKNAYRRNEKYPFNFFFEKIRMILNFTVNIRNNYYKLMNESIDEEEIPHHTQYVFRQAIISLVSLIEVFLKYWCKILIETHKFDYTNIPKKHSSKFTLEEIEFIQKNKLTLEEIVVHYANFQNLDHVRSFFSYLIFGNEKIFKSYFEKEEYTNGKDVLKYEFNNFVKLKEVFKLRHRIIHDFSEELIEFNNLLEYYNIGIDYCLLFENTIIKILGIKFEFEINPNNSRIKYIKEKNAP